MMRGGYSGDEGEKEGYMDIGVGAGKVQDHNKGWKSGWIFTGWRCMSLDKLSGLGARRLMSLAEMYRSPASWIRNERGELRRC